MIRWVVDQAVVSAPNVQSNPLITSNLLNTLGMEAILVPFMNARKWSDEFDEPSRMMVFEILTEVGP